MGATIRVHGEIIRASFAIPTNLFFFFIHFNQPFLKIDNNTFPQGPEFLQTRLGLSGVKNRNMPPYPNYRFHP